MIQKYFKLKQGDKIYKGETLPSTNINSIIRHEQTQVISTTNKKSTRSTMQGIQLNVGLYKC